MSSSVSFNKANAQTLFRKYLQASKTEWESDEIESFYKDLKVDPYEDVVVYLVAMHMGCERMGIVTENEFVKGC